MVGKALDTATILAAVGAALLVLSPVAGAGELLEPSRTLDGHGHGQARSALALTSEPPGQAVLLDGAPAGQTPRTLPGVPAGDHALRIGALDTVVTLRPGTTTLVSAFKGELLIRALPPEQAKPSPPPVAGLVPAPPTPPSSPPPAPLPYVPLLFR